MSISDTSSSATLLISILASASSTGARFGAPPAHLVPPCSLAILLFVMLRDALAALDVRWNNSPPCGVRGFGRWRESVPTGMRSRRTD